MDFLFGLIVLVWAGRELRRLRKNRDTGPLRISVSITKIDPESAPPLEVPGSPASASGISPSAPSALALPNLIS